MLQIQHLFAISLARVLNLGLLTVAVTVVYLLAKCVYLLFFHPLSKYPGPRFAAISEIWNQKAGASGVQPFMMQELHRKYGDVIRTGPNRLSFATVQAYNDIYGHVKPGNKRFLKSVAYAREEPRITSVRDPAEHAEQRRSLSHAFSARALRDQEEVLHEYTNLLLRQLEAFGERGAKAVNATDAFNWLTFDLIGDLAFGEPFGALATGSNEWVEGLQGAAMYQGISEMMKRDWIKRITLPLIWGQKLVDMRRSAEELVSRTQMKAAKRIEMGDSLNRVDFFGHLIKKKEVTQRYIMGNAQTLIVAGSETTATALTAIIFWLTKNPECLKKLQDEVRGAFALVDQITGDAAARCEYLHGVIEEGLRVSPPLATSLPRDCPGSVIDGEYVPAGITVSCENFALARDSRYWKDPEEFKPERWVGKGFGDDKGAFQSFSTGPRACLGINLAYLEMHVTLAKVVFAFDFELVSPDVEDWNKACKVYGMWQKPALMVKFHPVTRA